MWTDMDEHFKHDFRWWFALLSSRGSKAVQGEVEAVIATIDHSDIRGFGYPHGHDYR